jgi:hypothetical protein
LRAPSNIKIDGKAIEWHNEFQAYNKATDVFYTICNDDNNLYLVIQAKSPQIIEKIILGGISFSINTSGTKHDKNGVIVTYPEYDKKNPSFYIMLNNRPKPTNDLQKNKMQTDSFINVRNAQLQDKLKLIGVNGIKTIADNTISIYNEEGIKAMSLLDDQINYTCELAIPIKYIGLSIANPAKFSYNIKLNGTAGNRDADIRKSGSGRFILFTAPDGTTQAQPATPQGMAMVYPTDFWGEYTLREK